MGHHSVLFPTDLSYGSSSGVGFDHGIVDVPSGYAEYVSRRADESRAWDLSYAIKTPAQARTLIDFYLARHGLSNTWLLLDPADRNSTAAPWVGAGADTTVAANDQVIVESATAGQTTAQMVKRYTSGGNTHVRNIRHPVSGTVVMQKELPPAAPVSMTEGGDFSIDYATGLITFLSALAENTIVRAGFKFYCRARFDAEVDKRLAFSILDFEENTFPPVPVVEDIGSVPHVDLYDYGGSSQVAASFSWSPTTHGRAIRFAQTAAITVTMPKASDYPKGGLYGHWKNTTAFAATVKDDLGATILTLAANKSVLLVNGLDGSGQAWIAMGD